MRKDEDLDSPEPEDEFDPAGPDEDEEGGAEDRLGICFLGLRPPSSEHVVDRLADRLGTSFGSTRPEAGSKGAPRPDGYMGQNHLAGCPIRKAADFASSDRM